MADTHPLPFHYSYWVVPGRLMAGFFPGSSDPVVAEERQRELVACGIRYVINLMEPHETNRSGEPFPPYDAVVNRFAEEQGEVVTCARVPIRDMDVPAHETMEAILDEIDGALQRDEPVYVHCWGGKGRTGTVIGCWLVRHGIAEDGEAALQRLRELRHALPDPDSSPETTTQRGMVREWQRGE